MRAYYFCNMYLPAIQAGVQATHGLQEIVNKYIWENEGPQPEAALKDYKSWGLDHKTAIFLNAGWQSSLEHFVNFLSNPNNDTQVAFASFRESKEALNEAMTCVTVILREDMYDNSRTIGPLAKNFIKVLEDGTIEEQPSKPIFISDFVYFWKNAETGLYELVKTDATKRNILSKAEFTTIELAIMQYMFPLKLMA